MMNKAKMYEQNGIFLSIQKMSVDDEVVIGYKGLLLTSGAQQVYLREVEMADIYMGLYGNQYGYQDAEGVSPTERE